MAVLCIVFSQGFSYSCALPWSFWPEEASSLERSVHSNADKYFLLYACIQIFFSSKFPDLWISVILLYCLSLAVSSLLHWRLDRNGWRDPQHFWTHLETFPFPSWAGRTMWEMKINWLPLICFLFFFYFHSLSIWRLLKFQLDCGKLGVKSGFCNQCGRRRLPNSSAQTQDYCRTPFLVRFNLRLPEIIAFQLMLEAFIVVALHTKKLLDMFTLTASGREFSVLQKCCVISGVCGGCLGICVLQWCSSSHASCGNGIPKRN